MNMSRAADAAMERYAIGDDDAFAEVYAELAPRLFPFLRRYTSSAARAEDLLEQTFLEIHRGRSSFAPGAEVTPWAFEIARRLGILDRERA
jgi:RNA polymerase sigma-70 factor (ECF subfamily)